MNRPYAQPLHFPDDRQPGVWIFPAALALALAIGILSGVAIGWSTVAAHCPDGWGAGYANGELVECVPPLCGHPDRYLPEEGAPYMDVPCIEEDTWTGVWDWEETL